LLQRHTTDQQQKTGLGATECDSKAQEDTQNYHEEMSINQIINGNVRSNTHAHHVRLLGLSLWLTLLLVMMAIQESFPGLMSLVKQYLTSSHIDRETRAALDKYLELVSKRASGELMTMASYTRKFVTEHKAYHKDSVINDEITWYNPLSFSCMYLV
jgi:hypothetical protein